MGLDFERTPYAFLESPAFFGVVLVLAALSVALDRRGAQSGGPREAGIGVVAVAIGALLFAGSLADAGYPAWPGLVAGVACAALGHLAARALFGGARRRLDRGAGTLLILYADATALVLAALAVLAPPLSLLALAALAALIVLARRSKGRKFEGLRILR